MKIKQYIATAVVICGFSYDAQAVQIFKVIEEGLQRVAQHQLQVLEDNVGILRDQINIEKRVEQMTRQSVDHLNRVSDELSGQYNMGKLLNDAESQARRRWAPGLSGQGGSARYQKIRATYANEFSFKSGQEIYPKGQYMAAGFSQYKDVQEKALLSAKYISTNINDNIAHIEKLMQEIDKTPNQKASTDLNSRIQAQVALELIELKQVHALQLEALGSTAQRQVIDNNISAQFNRWA